MPSKMGWHINFPTEADAMVEQARRGKPAVIVYLNLGDPATAQRLKEASPNTLLFGRKYVDSQPLGSPVSRARDHFGRIRGSACYEQGVIDHWVGYNEIGPHVSPDYSDFEVELARLLHEEGQKYAAGSWSTGAPEVLPIYPNDKSDWTSELMTRVLRVADYVATHSYCAPRMDDPRGLDAGHPGEGWFTLRYEKAMRLLLEQQLGFELPPWVITECGVDSGATKWDAGAQGGWRVFTDAPGYLQQLAWYDGHLQRRPWMKGAAVYCWGTLDPFWDSYDIQGEMAGLLTDYMVEQQGQHPGEPPRPDWLLDLRGVLPTDGQYKVRQGGIGAVRAVTIHESDSATTTGPWQIAEYHIAEEPAGKDWPEIGYTACVAVDGRVWQTLDWNKHSYHAGAGPNRDSIGVCLLGSFHNGYEPPESQLAATRELIRYLEQVLGRPLIVQGHKDVMDDRECPGDTWHVWKRRLLGGPDPEPDWQRMYHQEKARVEVLEGGVEEIDDVVDRVMA